MSLGYDFTRALTEEPSRCGDRRRQAHHVFMASVTFVFITHVIKAVKSRGIPGGEQPWRRLSEKAAENRRQIGPLLFWLFRGRGVSATGVDV